jgi:transcriptional regulator with XRE-family HTH domain
MTRKRDNIKRGRPVLPARGHLGKALRSARLQSGLSLQILAHRAGLHLSVVSRLERAQRTVSEPTLRRLFVALGLAM